MTDETVPQLSLTEFLLARIAEEERYLRDFLPSGINGTKSAIAGCEAKRRILDAHPLTIDVVPVWTGQTPGIACENCAALGRSAGDIVEDIGPCDTLLALALPYADHPDYRDEWKP